MTIKIYTSINSVPEEVATSSQVGQGLFLNRLWFRNYEKHIHKNGSENKVYVVGNNERQSYSAIYPMVENIGVYMKQKVRRLQSMSNYYSSLYGPILTGGEERREGGNMADDFVSFLGGKDRVYDIVDMQPMNMDSSIIPDLEKAFRNNGYIVQRYFCFGNWYLNVSSRTFSEYVTSLPSKLRNTVKRKGKKFNKAFDVSFELVDGEDRLDDALKIFEKIYGSSWKQEEPYPGFIRGLAEMAEASGGLRLGLLYADGQPVAAQLWIIAGDTANIYKLAYDPEWGKYSVGSILTMKIMEHVIDVDQVKIVDYLTGDDAYKKDWMSDRRERWGIIAFNKCTFKGLWLGIVTIGIQEIKRILRVKRSDPP